MSRDHRKHRGPYDIVCHADLQPAVRPHSDVDRVDGDASLGEFVAESVAAVRVGHHEAVGSHATSSTVQAASSRFRLDPRLWFDRHRNQSSAENVNGKESVPPAASRSDDDS